MRGVRRSVRYLSAALAASALLALSCSGGDGGGDSAKDEAPPEREEAAPVNTYKGSVADVTYLALDGAEKKISDYGNKILFVNYIATWNDDSRKLVPIMNEVQRKFHKNVTVLGIVMDVKNASQAYAFKAENDVKFELLLPGGNPGRLGKPARLPTSHVVTRDDYLLTTFEGLFRADKYEDMILSMYRRRM